MGVEDNGGTGPRTETTDRPKSGDRPYTPPPDNPGSPGQPSRLESRARARQAQEQNTPATSGAQSAAGPRDTKPGSSQAGTESTGTQGRPDTGQSGPQNADPRSRDTGARTGGPSPGSRDRPQTQGTERETDTRTEPADKPAPPAQPYTLPADNPGSPGQPSRLESRARARQAQEQNTPATAPETGDTDDGPASSPEAAEPGDPQPISEQQPLSEETAENHGTQEPRAEADGDRGKKAEDDGTEQDLNETNETNPEAHANPILSDVYTDGSGQVHVEARYGREQTARPGTESARNEPETTEPAELPTREDLDPAGAQAGDAGRGEPRDPDDDPASRDYQESDPDSPSPGRDSLRRFLNTASDAKDATNTYSETAQKNLERVQPTGQLSSARPENDQMRSSDQSANVGDAVVGAVGAAIVVTEVVRSIVNLARQARGREHADN
ncbi:hypothetical protein [Actinomadura sp. GTD37]|uniref:hypothetical protein n=1 Tax=Actinomadura sp. GTD37 TaxID=1778030 RepID=UPI0035BFCDE6